MMIYIYIEAIVCQQVQTAFMKKTHPCSMVLVTCIQFRSNEIRSIRRAINTDFPQCPNDQSGLKGVRTSETTDGFTFHI